MPIPDSRDTNEALIRQRKVLADFGDFALQSEDLDAVLHEACRLVGEALGTSRAKVLEIEPGGESLFVRAGVGWDPSVVGLVHVSMTENSSESYAIKMGRPVITQDISQEERFELPDFLKEAGIVALANVPIFLPGKRAFGLLQVDDTKPRDFDQDDTEFLRTYANILGPVIDRLYKLQELRASEERYRAIVETATDYGIFTIDPGGRIETWPAGAQAVYGWPAEEAIGLSVDMTFTPEDRALGAPDTERLTARTAGYAPDVRWHLRRDGSRVFIDGATRPLTSPDGSPAGFVKVGQDVTERRATEDALRESEARFRQFGDATSDVLWIRDAKTLQFEYVSPAFEEVYGHKLEHLLGGNHVRRWVELILPEDRALALDHLRRVRKGEHVLNTFRIVRLDGQVRWMRDTGFPILDDEGQVQRIAGIGHDATEEVELQDRLRVLVAELQHRSRNLVGVVRAVTDRTLATSETLGEFQGRFRPRLDALSRVNSLLSRMQEGDRITFDQLLQTELQAHGVIGFDGQGEQVSLRGPKGIRLRSASVQTFALALHELATNALKYGALSRPEGRLEVKWSLVPGMGGERRLRVDWRETGVLPEWHDGSPPAGPIGGEPASRRQGYGRELIERALPYQLKAQTSYEITPEGVRCTITVPVSSTLDVAFSSLEQGEPDA
jgi:PAS domain S-box-containing protein